MPGPLPKRIEERRRKNAVPGETTIVMEGPVEAPELPRTCRNAVARAWYASLSESGQAQFFEPSDWALAVVAAHALGKALGPKGNASMINAAWMMIDALLTTEAGRRKARLHVRRVADGEAEPEKPSAIEEYRKALSG